MAGNNKQSYIYKSNGDILREVAIGHDNNSTQLPELPISLQNEFIQNSNAKNASQFTTYLPYSINKTSDSIYSNSGLYGKIQVDSLDEKHEFSYNEIQKIINEQLEAKLNDFLEKSEVHKNETKSQLEKYDKELESKFKRYEEKTEVHKNETTTKLGHFEGLLDKLLNYKQSVKSNSIAAWAISVGLVIGTVSIAIGFISPFFIGYVTNVNELMTEKQLMKKDIDITNDKIKEISDKVNKIETNSEEKMIQDSKK